MCVKGSYLIWACDVQIQNRIVDRLSQPRRIITNYLWQLAIIQVRTLKIVMMVGGNCDGSYVDNLEIRGRGALKNKAK